MVFQDLPPMQRAWVEGDPAEGKVQRSWEKRPVGKGRRPPSAEGSSPNIAKLLLASVYPLPASPSQRCGGQAFTLLLKPRGADHQRLDCGRGSRGLLGGVAEHPGGGARRWGGAGTRIPLPGWLRESAEPATPGSAGRARARERTPAQPCAAFRTRRPCAPQVPERGLRRLPE